MVWAFGLSLAACNKPGPELARPIVPNASFATEQPVNVAPRYALVSVVAWLHAAPTEKSHRIRLDTKARQGSAMGFRLDDEQPEDEDWVALRTSGAFEHGGQLCDVPQPGSRIDVRVYVRTRDVFPTLSRKWSYEVDDDLEIVLGPGVALRSMGGRQYRVEAPAFELVVELDPEWIAPFVVADFRRPQHVAVPFFAKGPLVVRVGDIEVRLREDEIRLEHAAARGDIWRVTYDDWCARIVGHGGDLIPMTPREPGYFLAVPFDGLYLPPGTVLSWPDGTHAGRATGGIQVDAAEVSIDGRACFASAAFFDGAPIQLCVAPSAIRDPKTDSRGEFAPQRRVSLE